jgi:NADPH-ferrihemoprotein reductase
MGFAMQLSEALGDTAGFSASVTDLYEYAPKELLEVPPEQGVVFVVSCFGKGEPTDSAKKFFAWLTDSARDAENAARLASGQPPLLGHLNYTLFGLGSSQTHNQHYNVIGRRLDARLQELGGQCFFKRGEGDDSGVLELDFEKWQQELLAAATGGDAAPADAALAAPSNPAAASRPGALASAAPMAASASSAPSAARPKTCESLDKPLT